MAAPKRILPPALAANRWRPGQSGNPSGHSGEYDHAMKLARQAAPRAVQRLIELMDSEDERVAAVACNSLLDRAFGKPGPSKEEKTDTMEARLANMTREQRSQYMRELLESVRHYFPGRPKTTAAFITARDVSSGSLRALGADGHQQVPGPARPLRKCILSTRGPLLIDAGGGRFTIRL
jgi:hypothetical protein